MVQPKNFDKNKKKKKKLVKCFAKRMSIYIVVVESIESNVCVQLVGRLD